MDSKEKNIQDIMKEINNNKLLLPNFQRDFNWDKEKQKSLIASIFYNVPIGSLLFLETETNMMTKTIGYKNPNNSEGEKANCYLMDGQQRLTTIKGVFDDFFKKGDNQIFDELYNNLKSRWFFKLGIFDKKGKIDQTHLRIILDLIKYAEIKDDKNISDIKDLIIQNKIVKTKKRKPFHPHVIRNRSEDFENFLINNQYVALFLILSTIERTDLSSKYKELLKEPTQKIFQNKWFLALKNNHEEKNKFIDILKEYDISIDLDDRDKVEKLSQQWADDIYETLQRFLTDRRKIFIITYKDNFPKAVEAFTAMNTGGLPLSAFDIIAAKYSAFTKEELLKDRIKNKFNEACNKKHNILPSIDTEKLFNHFKKDKDEQKFHKSYLNMLGIFSSNNHASDHIKEKHKLSLTKEDIDRHTDKAVTSIALAFRFLSGYCGVSNINEISYELMLIPMAKNLYDKHNNLSERDMYKILYWYWSALFGGRYREKQNPRSIEDIKNLKKLLDTGKTEGVIEETSEKVFNDPGYSDSESLKDQETPKLEYPILQFILTYGILNNNLNNYSKVIDKLKDSELEKSHLISLNDFNQNREQPITRKKKHYINSVFNLALLPKPVNREDRAKSWFSWSNREIKEYKAVIPNTINSLSWDDFSIKVRNANNQDKENLYKTFIEARDKEITNTIKKYLKNLEKKWGK